MLFEFIVLFDFFECPPLARMSQHSLEGIQDTYCYSISVTLSQVVRSVVPPQAGKPENDGKRIRYPR